MIISDEDERSPPQEDIHDMPSRCIFGRGILLQVLPSRDFPRDENTVLS